jgi:protocatechuate 3,4-dioxygenase beta subunit
VVVDADAPPFNVLTLPGIVRSDIRSNLDGTAPAGGVPLALNIALVSQQAACTPLAGHAIYVWHCTREGDYSVYSSGNLHDNQLRGVQVTDARGQARFRTIMPGCYMGRMPHIHFEVYAGLAQAVHGRNAITTSQLAFPNDSMASLYASAEGYGYGASARNLKTMSFATDMVFADGVALQMLQLRGSVARGFEAGIQVAIAA